MLTFFLLSGLPRPTYPEAGMVVMEGLWQGHNTIREAHTLELLFES